MFSGIVIPREVKRRGISLIICIEISYRYAYFEMTGKLHPEK